MVAKNSFMEVYRQRTYQLAAIIGAAGMAILLVWSSQIVTVFPQGGLFLDVDALTLVSMALAAALMGITLPLHWFAWRRTRWDSAGPRFWHSIFAFTSSGSR
jgi:hypothetical protein